MPRETWVAHLAAKWGEAPLSRGLTPDGRLFEVFAAPEGRTWTVLITGAKGVSCLLADGEYWQETTPKLLKPMGQGQPI